VTFEDEAVETLGFYPSYLAAVADEPQYAELVWEQTERAVNEPAVRDAGERVARAAVPAVRELVPDATPAARGEQVDETVRFFSFVMFRLTFTMVFCRYALDGRSTLTAHAEPVPTGEGVPSRIADGLDRSAPADPDITLVQPPDAEGQVRDLYDRLLVDLDTPNVNNVFRGLAFNSDLLAAVVDAQAGIDAEERHALERRMRGWYARAVADAGLSVPDHWRVLRGRSLDHAAVDSVASRMRAFHENLPTLATTIVLADLVSEPVDR